MKNRNQVVVLCLFLLGLFAASCSAQEEKADEKTEKVKIRAEKFLQTVREERWSDIYKLVDVSTGKASSYSKDRFDITENDSEEAATRKVGDFFKSVYGAVKPGHIRSIEFKRDTFALISYWAGDLDGFYMHKIDGEWYYTLDYK
ncbi:MAG: hypothetical protein HKN25_05910 [Pyrinomonadaceae bacterium]|nr:hypothetical protein [Pyrinomonadaceae bacterium]